MDSNVTLRADNATIILELEKIGFDRFEIDRALEWLNGLNEFQQAVKARPVSNHSIRHFLPEEVERLGVEGQGFLLYLEQINILDPTTREIVIDRVMALDPREVDPGRVRWVILMVLFNQPDKKSALNLMQEMILVDAFKVMH